MKKSPIGVGPSRPWIPLKKGNGGGARGYVLIDIDYLNGYSIRCAPKALLEGKGGN